LITTIDIEHSPTSIRTFSTPFFKHISSPHLYRVVDNDVSEFKLQQHQKSKGAIIYPNVPYESEFTFSQSEFYPVDVTLTRNGYKVMGKIPHKMEVSSTQSYLNPMSDEFNNLPESLRQICGNVKFPPDSGDALMQKIEQTGSVLFGASDAALKEGKATQAWLLTSGETSDVEQDLYNISGSGPVDGFTPFMSSTWAELAGLTAISVVASLFLQVYSSTAKVKIICDNKGVIAKSGRPINANLRFHRQPKSDLLLTQKATVDKCRISYEWVKGHTEKGPWKSIQDLEEQKLSHEEIFNVWCDGAAENEWAFGSASCFDPAVSPAEKWAIFTQVPYHYKLIGDLSSGIPEALGY